MTSSTQLPESSGYKKYLIWFVPFVAVIALVLLMKASGNGQTEKPPFEPKKQLVNVMAIKWHEQYVQKRLTVGRAEAPQTAAIGFDLAGSVVSILVNEGQMVEQGQLLAEVDDQRLVAKMSELSAILNRAKSEQNLAELSLKRVTDLVDKKLESVQRLDESTESVNAANAFVNEVLARKKSLQVEIDKTKLLAPFDGNIVSRLVDEGTVVGAGQTLFSLQKNGKLEVRFAVSADHANKFVVGQTLSLAAHSDQVLGQVKSIAQQRRLDTRTVDVIIRLNEQNLAIIPGDILHIDISSEIQAQGFWVPRKALVSGVRGLWSLFVVEFIDGEHRLVAKLVEMVHADDKKAFVRGALNDGETVVVEGVQRLVPGQKVIVGDNSLASIQLGVL